MEDKSKEFKIENAFEELEQIISQLESDSVSLRDSIVLYGKGAKLLADCKEELIGIEKEMIVIGENLEQGDTKDEF